jgi:phosphate transport system substrate-binding protein
LKRADLPRIYTAASPSWADGTPIRVVLRPRSETDTALLGDLSAGMNEAIEAARLRAEVPVAPTDQDNVALAKDAPGSLASSTTTQLKTERVQLQIVPLDDLKPTLANVQSGAYPYVKMLYVVIRANGQASAQGFVDFLRSPLGLAALREAEILPDGE